MAVYVDHARIPYRGMRMNHLMPSAEAGSLAELHAIAEILGLRRYFQDKDVPHYDICCAKREQALRAGVIPIDRRGTALLVREWRAHRGRSLSGSVADGPKTCV